MFSSYNDNTLKYDQNVCINCGMCLKVCTHDVFEKGEKTALLVNKEACMECGACALNCPAGAIQVDSGTGGAIPVIMALLGHDEDSYRHDRMSGIKVSDK